MSINKIKLASLTKSIDEIQNLLKIEKENYNDVILRHNNEIAQLNLEYESANLSLEQYLNDLNKIEKEIYEIQSSNLEMIKNDLNKYIQINNDLKQESEKKKDEIEECILIENSKYNIVNMYFEDLDATNYIVDNLQNKIKDIDKEINKIKNSYTKDFKILGEDYENNEKKARINLCMKEMKKKTKENNFNNEGLKKQLEEDNKILLNKENEFNQLNDTINFQLKKDSTVQTISDSIKIKLRDNLNFSLIKGILEKFFSIKDFDLENKLEKKELNDLILHLDFVRNEFNNYYDIKNDEMQTKGRQIQEINSIRPLKQSNKKDDLQKNFVEISKDVMMLKNIIDYLSKMIKKYCNLLIKDNYSHVIFSNLDNDFFNEILQIIFYCLKNDSYENKNEIKSKYFLFISKLRIKFIEIKNLTQQQKILGNELKKLKDIVNKKNEKIEKNIKENNQFEEELIQCNNNLKVIDDNINFRNPVIRKNLENLKVKQFENYLKQNEKLYKDLLKNGNKVKNNELSTTKNYFIDQVLIDHSLKKNNVVDLFEKKIRLNDILTLYLDDLCNLKISCQHEKEKYKSTKNKLDQLYKEEQLLEKNSNDISKIIDKSISGLEENTLEQKKQLQEEKNIPFYKNQIKSINEKLNLISQKKENENTKFELKKNEFEDKIKKLTDELNKLKEKKNNIIQPEKKNNQLNENNNEENNYIISAFSTINPILNNLNKVSPQKKIHNMETKGIILYKKVNNNSRSFDYKNSKNFPPEKCGYLKRLFLYYSKDNTLIIKDMRLNAIEYKIKIENIKNIMLNPNEKNIIKIEKEKNFNYSILDKGPFIQLFLILYEGNIDIVAPNYLSYELFSNFINVIKKYPTIKEKENDIEDDFSLTNTIVI